MASKDGSGGSDSDGRYIRRYRCMRNRQPLINMDLIAEISHLCFDKGWRVNVEAAREGYEFPAYIALAHSELSEALEAFRIKDWSSTDVDGKPMGIGPELADTIIRILDMCDIWNIDINTELARVLDFGWTRPYQHGGKTL